MNKSQIFATDGSVIPNIRTQDYRVTYAPDRTHTKIKAAQIVISAETAEDARRYASQWLRLPMMVVATVEQV